METISKMTGKQSKHCTAWSAVYTAWL